MIKLLVTILVSNALYVPSLCQDSQSQEEQNPFLEAAKSFLEDAVENQQGNKDTLSAIGGLVQGFLQNGQVKQLGDMLGGQNNNLAATLISTVASSLNANKNEEPNQIDFSQIVDVLASSMKGTGKDKENEIPESSDQQPVDWESLLGMASSFLSSSKNENSGLEGLLNILPMLSNGFSGSHVHFADSELEDEEEHKKSGKSTFLPPFLQNIYEYWDHFKQSDLGKALWSNSGLEDIFQKFTDHEGYFQIDRIFESMENTSFRRRWIKSLSMFIGGWVKHFSDPATQARYLGQLQFIANGFLKSQGYSKQVQFDAQRPTESSSFLIDAVFKRQFGLKVNSSAYIRPAVAYIQDIFKIGQSKGLSVSHLSSQEIGSRLSDVINGDIIEPVLRVWRAYRYINKVPQCDRHIMCALNIRKEEAPSKAGLKPLTTKFSSLIASWYLSGRTGTPFWKLYNAITEEHNCQVKYPANCQQFFEEDLRVTTEYAHNEL